MKICPLRFQNKYCLKKVQKIAKIFRDLFLYENKITWRIL